MLERDTATVELARLPDDALEYLSVAPDSASLDAMTPTAGLPLESARTPDPEVVVHEQELLTLLRRSYKLDAEVVAAGRHLQHISVDGLHLTEGFEGFSNHIYLDSVRVPTIGYGTTGADFSPLPTHCTRAQAEGWLRSKMASKYEPAVRSLGVPLNRHQFDALCSFVYNLGPGSMSPAWTIGRLLRARRYRDAADSMLMYDRAGGVVLLGLTRRRQAERHLFLTPVPRRDPHHYKRFVNGELIDGLNERRTVVRFDTLLHGGHRARHHAELLELQAGIVKLRKRDWVVAHENAPPVTWGLYWRGWRWQELDRRSRIDL